MNFIDYLLLLSFFLFAWIGSRRGVVIEFFEMLIVSFNFLLCSHVYRFLSFLFVQFLKTPPPIANVISYLFFFAIIAIILWICAGKTQISTNFPPSNGFNRMGGAILAFAKIFVIAWIVLFFISLAPMSSENRKPFHESPMVKAVQNLNPMVDAVVSVAGSPELYKSLHPEILKFNF